MNLFARAVLRGRRIPFEITASDDLFYSVKNQIWLERSLLRVEAGLLTERYLLED